MDILLILPLNDPFDEIVHRNQIVEWKQKKSTVPWIKSVMVTYPNGLLSLASYISKYHQYSNIKIVDCNLLIHKWAEKHGSLVTSATAEEFWNYCFDSIPCFSPTVLGISLMFCGMQKDFSIFIDFLRKKYKSACIVAGSHLASAQYEVILQMIPSLDAICFGEGEIPFAGLVAALQEGFKDNYLSTAKSWITRDKLEYGFIPEAEFIENLDEIPPYNFSIIIDWELYSLYSKPITFMEKKCDLSTFYMFTSRGCPGKCIFCASHNVHGRKIRRYGIERIKSDIYTYIYKYRIGIINFYDDHFLHDKKNVIELLSFMKDNNFPVDVGNPAFFSLDETIVMLLKYVGVEKVIISIESANENTLKNIIHKPGSLKQATKAVKSLQKEGITVIGNIIIGFPGETKAAIDKCVNGMLEIGCDWYSCSAVTPLPGSELFDICLKDQYFQEDSNIYEMNFKKCIIKTGDFTPSYIERKIYEINLFVNYINNYNMISGNYKKALLFFEGILNDMAENHAFAYYYAAVCAGKLNYVDKYALYKEYYYTIISASQFWRDWRTFFSLPDLK